MYTVYDQSQYIPFIIKQLKWFWGQTDRQTIKHSNICTSRAASSQLKMKHLMMIANIFASWLSLKLSVKLSVKLSL